MSEETKPKFSVGQVVKHKIGVDVCIHAIKTELRDQNGMLVQLDEPFYVVGYKLDNGQIVAETFPESVLE